MSQQLTRRPLRLLLPAALAASLVVTACGSDSGPSVQELESEIAPSDEAAAPVAKPSELAELRFDPETAACDPRRTTTGAPGAWETSAPRTGVTEAAPIELRDTKGSGDVPAVAQVTAPGGQSHEAKATVSGDDWAKLEFPADFADADSLADGTYTLVWTTGEGAYIACDGFSAE